MRAVAVLAALMLASCRLNFDDVAILPDASTTAPPDFVSGTRLRAIVADGDGTQSLARLGWFDTQLGEQCSIFLAEDGVQRCLPDRVLHGSQYADSACTVPLMRLHEPLDAASCPTAALLGTVEIGDHYRVVQVGAKHAGTLYQSVSGGPCVTVTSNDAFYLAGATVPPDQLVGFTERVVDAGGLRYMQLASDDGALQLDPYALADGATGERCTLSETRWGEAACIGDRPTGSSAFADAACTEAAVVTVDTEATDTMLVYGGGLCETTLTEATLGDELATYYYQEPAGCTARTTSATGTRAWRVTSSRPAVPTATATLVVGEGTGAIARARWQFTTGHSLPAGLYDRRHNDFCYPLALKDTLETVCAPLWTGSGGIFGDASCMQGMIAWPSCAGAWRSTWYPTAPAQNTCGGWAMFVRRYDVPVTAQSYTFAGTSCVPIDPSITIYMPNTADYAQSEMIAVTRRRE